ncbi:MAG: hypothetical protein IPO27_02590 [Bacteroidetes bacterium]|nr:hypothetical protein [Bacteroidota bacterium]
MNNHKQIIFRLTALWALNESLLGGMLHAFKFPFTGILVGGFAVVLIGLIGFYSKNKWKDILVATFMVMVTKMLASPFTPFAAYIAVAFQGLSGALIYMLIPKFRVAALVAAIIALVQSAIQKILILLLLFGKSLPQAIDAFVNGIMQLLHVNAGVEAAKWLAIGYVLLYLLVGIAIGSWLGNLPVRIVKLSESINLDAATNSNSISMDAKRGNPYVKFIMIMLTAISIAAVLYITGKNQSVLYVLGRACLAIIFLFYLLPLLIKYLLTRILKSDNAWAERINHLFAEMEEIKTTIPRALAQAGKGNPIARYKRFAENLLVMVLFK